MSHSHHLKSNTNASPSSSVDVIDLTEIPAETDDLIKQAISNISHLAFLSREIENDKAQIDIYQAKHQGTQSVNKIKIVQEALTEKVQSYHKQQILAVEGVGQIADKYKETFSLGLEEVRERIEESMVKFGSILSKDALNQINKRSSELSIEMVQITEEHGKKIMNTANDMKLKLQQCDEKYNTLSETLSKYSKTISRLSDTNLRYSQAIAINSNKINTFQQIQNNRNIKIEKDMASLKDRILGHTVALENLSKDLTASIKTDMATLSDQLHKLHENQKDDRKSLETLKSYYTSVKQQITDTLKQKNTGQSSTSSSSSSSSIENTFATEYINLESTINKQQQIINELQQKVTILGRNTDTSLDTTLKNNNKTASTRLEDLEKHMTQLLSKVEAVHKHIELNKKNYSVSILGTKSSLESITNDHHKFEALEKNVKRMDNKLTDLAEFMYQFQSTILNPDFPARLETTILTMETCLKNHEMFIAYLVDPVAAVKLSKNKGTIDDQQHGQQGNSLVSPALLSTLSQFIMDELKKQQQQQQSAKRRKVMDQESEKVMRDYMKKYMDELATNQVEPLKRKIQLLEQQLQNKLGQK